MIRRVLGRLRQLRGRSPNRSVVAFFHITAVFAFLGLGLELMLPFPTWPFVVAAYGVMWFGLEYLWTLTRLGAYMLLAPGEEDEGR